MTDLWKIYERFYSKMKIDYFENNIHYIFMVGVNMINHYNNVLFISLYALALKFLKL